MGELNLLIFHHCLATQQNLAPQCEAVIYHIQEHLEAAGYGILMMPVQDEVVASFTTATSVRVPIKPPAAHWADKGRTSLKS